MKNLCLRTSAWKYATVSLVMILFGIVFTCQIAGENQRALTKGYLLSFSAPYGCGGIPKPRIYHNYYFTSNAQHNDSTLYALRQALKVIGRSYDNLHAADITFSDHTTYDYYLKVIEACHEYSPKEIVSFENRMYIHGIGKHRLREESITNAFPDSFIPPALDMNYP